jgi:hypothetical protein
MLAKQPGAHAFVQRYTPIASKVTTRSTRSYKYTSSNIRFGNKVDEYLEQFVDQGWLDLSYVCNQEFEELIANGDRAAKAAHDIRLELILAGFIATESQICASAFGMSPILDLLGYNRVGECVIVELKCGRSSLDHSTSSGFMRPPFETLNHNGHTKAMMQLAIQRSCISYNRNMCTSLPHAWLITHAYLSSSPETSAYIVIKRMPEAIFELVNSTLLDARPKSEETTCSTLQQ